MFDFLEKGQREVNANNYMTAYSIEGHPHLHMTHHYFKNLSEDQVKGLTQQMQQHFAEHPLEEKPVNLEDEELFGPDHDIRVLVNDKLKPALDPELKTSFEQQFPSEKPFRPHVSNDNLPEIKGKIKHFYFVRGDGKVLFSTTAQGNNLEKGTNMAAGTPKVNAKVEGIEVKRSQSGAGVAGGISGVKSAPGAAPVVAKVGVPPKLSPTTGKMNNTSPMQKAEGATENVIDYSKFKRPTYSTSGENKPIHNPIQHSKGMTTTAKPFWKSEGLKKAHTLFEKRKLEKTEAADKELDRKIEEQKAKGKMLDKDRQGFRDGSLVLGKPPASLIKAEDSGYAGVENQLVQDEGQPKNLTSLKNLRKCMALKKAEAGQMPVHMRD